MRIDQRSLAALALRLTLGLTLLLGPFNRSAEHDMLHEVAEGTWAPLGLVGGAEAAFALVDLLELGLGAALLAGFFTRWTALATVGLFAAFIAGIGLTELNRDVGLLLGAGALALLGSPVGSVDQLLKGRLGRLGALEDKLINAVGARIALPAPALAAVTLRLGLGFTLLSNGVLLLRGVASFGSPIFSEPQPAWGLGLAELALGLGLLAGWRTRWLGAVTALYFGASLAWLGFGTQMRSLALAGGAGALALLGASALPWERFQAAWQEGWQTLPTPSRLGLAAVAVTALLALGPAAAFTARDLEGHQIYFETHGREAAPVGGGAAEDDTADYNWQVGEYNLTYLTFSLQVNDDVGAEDTVEVELTGPHEHHQRSETTSEGLEFTFILGRMPREGEMPEAMGAQYMHDNGTGEWSLQVSCDSAPGTTVLGQDLGDDGQCDWSWDYELVYYEAHVVEHGH